MPNFDTGHLFLTFLTPIKGGSTRDLSGVQVSHEQMIRMTLALLPTALQSPATQKIGLNSPFARNRQTHLCRLFVLEDAIYNGRNPKNALAMSIMGEDPIQPQAVDRLNAAYLVFVADIDAVITPGDPLPTTLDTAGEDAARDAWARRLWETMEPELRALYGNCHGFDDVTDGPGFAGYLARCQIETTMPFNDYWVPGVDLPKLPARALAALVGLPLLLTLVAVLCGLFGIAAIPLLGWAPWVAVFTGLALTAIAIVLAIRFVTARGMRPMPPGRHADLPSVLKSLYLQQAFADFVIDQQGATDAALHSAFGDFLARHRPSEKMAPSQAPGVISIRAEGGIVDEAAP